MRGRYVRMSPEPSPTLQRRRLARELRRLRHQRGMTTEKVAEQMDMAQSTVSRIERAKRGVQIRDLKALMRIYGVGDEEWDQLLTMATASRQRRWWHYYSDAMSQRFYDYVGLEAEATTLHTYQSELVPGLLQTSEYYRTVLNAAPRVSSDEEVERMVEVRQVRQRRLTEDDEPPEYWAVLNEAVLRRVVGHPETMRAQLFHLVKLAELPHVTIQVLPFASGVHPAMGGSFMLLGFPERKDRDIAYVDTETGGLYLEAPKEVERYKELFTRLRANAMHPEESVSLTKRVASDIPKT